MVVWGLYLFDCIRRVDDGQFLIALSRKSLHAIFLENVYTIARKSVYLAGFLRPSYMVFQERWFPPNLTGIPSASQRRYLMTLNRAAEPFRMIGFIQGWILLIYGPILTYLYNLGFALTTVLIIAYLNNIIAVILLRKSTFWSRLPKKHYRHIISDLFLCVPYGINITERISKGITLPFYLFPHLLHPSPSEETKAVLRRMVDEMLISYEYEEGNELIENMRALGES